MSLLGDVFKIGSKLIGLIPGKKKHPGPLAVVTREELYDRHGNPVPPASDKEIKR